MVLSTFLPLVFQQDWFTSSVYQSIGTAARVMRNSSLSGFTFLIWSLKDAENTDFKNWK